MQVSESKAADGLYVDVGTQTHSFRSAPFTGRTTLADTLAGRPLKLHLQLQTERVNSRHNRASSAFTFLCGHAFHRREFATHFRCSAQTSLLLLAARAKLHNLSDALRLQRLTGVYSPAGMSTVMSRRL